MKHASEAIRILAVNLYKSGNYTQQEVADITGYHRHTIRAWLKADAEGKPQCAMKRGHRAKVLNPDDLLKLRELVNSGAYNSLSELTVALGKGSRSVVHRAMRELGYTYKKKRYMPTNGAVKR